MLHLEVDEIYVNETSDEGYSPYRILLDDTNKLNAEADRLQLAKGERVLFDLSAPEGLYDDVDWYDFFVKLTETGDIISILYRYGFNGEECGEIEIDKETKKNIRTAIDDFFSLTTYESWMEYRNWYEREW